MLAHFPALVDLGGCRRSGRCRRGGGGEDPRDATAAHGEACIAASLALIEEALQQSGH